MLCKFYQFQSLLRVFSMSHQARTVSATEDAKNHTFDKTDVIIETIAKKAQHFVL